MGSGDETRAGFHPAFLSNWEGIEDYYLVTQLEKNSSYRYTVYDKTSNILN